MKKLLLLLSVAILNTSLNNKIYCDIKGNVNKPGVYEIKENYTIQDVINAAGGLKKDSYTKNINLSKKVTDEMVIYIYNKNEINKINELNNCTCKPIYKYTECETTTTSIIEKETTTKDTTTTIPTTTTTKILLTNINTATIEELLTLNGLGKVKAEAIIKYRIEFGLFKTIEDIMNVKGIGESTFEKIKEYITI